MSILKKTIAYLSLVIAIAIMNHLKKTIVFFSIALALLLPAFFLAPTASADTLAPGTECSTVTDAYFEPVTVSSPLTKDGVFSFNYAGSTNPSIKVIVATSNCVGQRLNVAVIEETGLNSSVSVLNEQEWLVPTSGKLEFTVTPTEELCGVGLGEDCQYRIEAGYGSETYDSSEHEAIGATKGYMLKYECRGGTCFDDGAWKITAKNGVLVSTTCTISESTSFYTNLGPTPLDLRVSDDARLELAVFANECVGWTGKIILTEHKTISESGDMLAESTNFIFNQTGLLTRLPFVAGETKCDKGSPNCSITATITPYNKETAGTAFSTKYLLKYNCLVPDDCKEDNFWNVDQNPANLSEPLAKKTKIGSAISGTECEVVSSAFAPHTTKDGTADYELSHLETHGWFWEEHRDTENLVTLTIRTKKCAGTSIFVDVVGSTAPVDVATIKTLHNRAFIVPETEVFTIKLIAGEEGCGGGASGADCKFNIKTSIVSATSSTTGEVSKVHDSISEVYGNLNYKCDTLCNTAVTWKYAGDTSAKPYPSDPLDTANPVTLEDDGSASISPECMGADGKAIEGCYKLYGGFEEILTKVGLKNMNSIGDFINAIIALGIGIAGVITVGMIMWDGFTYWRAGKTGNEIKLGEVKGRIWKRLLGLLLLFTIYTLLRTINPDLLNLTPRIDLALLDSGEQGDGVEDTNAASDESKDFSKTKPKACKEGFEKVYSFISCKTIAPKLKALVDAAKADGLTLGGGGFRTLEEQINLRKNNCGGSDNFSIYEKRAKECKPPTAIPGTSRHEQGLAFDFTCNGKGAINVAKRKETEVCFNWLKANASKYGLKNLSTENWHWSNDGK